MPKLVDLFNMNSKVIAKWIVRTPHSRFYGLRSSVLMNNLTEGEISQEMARLIVLNGQFQSDLSKIEEEEKSLANSSSKTIQFGQELLNFSYDASHSFSRVKGQHNTIHEHQKSPNTIYMPSKSFQYLQMISKSPCENFERKLCDTANI